MSMKRQLARLASTLPSTTRRSHELISPDSAISRPTISVRSSVSLRRCGVGSVIADDGSDGEGGISMPGRTLSLGRGGCGGITGALPRNPVPGRVAGLPAGFRLSLVDIDCYLPLLAQFAMAHV